MGPDCQLLKISVAWLMDGGWFPSVTDWMLEQRGFLLVCWALGQATLVFVMYELLHRWNPPVKQAAFWYLPSVNIWDLVKKKKNKKKPVRAGVCKQELKRQPINSWTEKKYFEIFFLFGFVQVTSKTQTQLCLRWLFYSFILLFQLKCSLYSWLHFLKKLQ